MPRGRFHHRKHGQAMAELVIALVVIVILVVGTATLAQLALAQIRLRRDVRAEAGQEGLNRATAGWLESENEQQNGQNQFRSAAKRINEYAELNTFSPALSSRLPASNYTLQARGLPTGELGLRTTRKSAIVPIDATYTRLIHNNAPIATDAEGNSGIRLNAELTYPAASGLWPKSGNR